MTTSSAPAFSGLQLRSLVKASGHLELSLVTVDTPEPAADEVIVRVQAAPLNPSDIGLLFGAADISTASLKGAGADSVMTMTIPDAFMKSMAGRMDHPCLWGMKARVWSWPRDRHQPHKH